MLFRLLTFIFLIITIPQFAQQVAIPGRFEKKILIDQLEDPWTIIYGPDHHLWITEAKGYRVLRFDVENAKVDTLADLNNLRNFPRYDTINDETDGGKPWPQAGLMGMALHPDLLTGKPFVYLAYLYEFEGRHREGKGIDSIDGGFHFLTKIVRYTYDSVSAKLVKPLTICDSLPGSNDHNGGRLLVASVEKKQYLFYSIGDMGAGQFDNAARVNHAQDAASYEGKILRFETEPMDAGQTGASWIPDDNPFNSSTKSAVWSVGHRNPQGFTKMTVAGKEQIYSAEHGPFSDDEVNIIVKGSNYGHPLVIGYADGNYNGLAAAVNKSDSLPGEWNTTYPLIVSEQQNAHKLKRYKDPLKSFYPTSNKRLLSLSLQLKKGAGKDPEWSSLAPSGLTAYNSDFIPGWNKSLLVTSLKQGVIRRLKLNEEGLRVIAEEELFKESARYRDVAVSPDGSSIFIVTDKSAVTSGPTSEKPGQQGVHGAIIQYTYKKSTQ